MLRPEGYGVLADPDGVREHDTVQCGHCQKIMAVKPMAAANDLPSLCRACMRFVCPACEGQTCMPWEKQMEAIERGLARQRFLRDCGA